MKNFRPCIIYLCRPIFGHAHPGVKVDLVLKNGMAVESILDFIKNQPVELVVMGARGSSALKEVLLGSVSAGVISKTRTPVLTVPPGHEIHVPCNILFATREFERDKRIVNVIVALARLLSAEVYVTVFLKTGAAQAVDYMATAVEMEKYMTFLKEEYPDILFFGKRLEGDDFGNTVDWYCQENEVELVAMVRYAKGFLDQVMRRSLTRKFLFHSSVPLLTIPAG